MTLEFCPYLLPEFVFTGHEVCQGSRVEIPPRHRAVFDLVQTNPDVFPGFYHIDLAGNVLPKVAGCGSSASTRPRGRPWIPRPALRAVKCPVLAVNGEKDVQVAARENLESIRENLAAGGNKRVRTVALPGLNHLLQKCDTGAVFEYGSIHRARASRGRL